jgi:predicted ribonuclease YlaK
VLLELNKIKKNPKLRHIVARVIEYLVENPDAFKVLNSNSVADPFANLVDNFILDEIQSSGIDTPVLVTNDRIFQLQARLRGIKSEIYKESVPFKSEAEYFTGFVASLAEAVPNAFMWNEQGKPVFFGAEGEKLIDYQHKVWKVTPRNVSDVYPPQFNPKNFEILPLAYIRGMNIENAVVIIDEMQNMSRSECLALLTRMGDGVKCLCLGDTRQVDNPYLNQENNGLNWVVKKFKGSKIYSHIVLKGEKSRGPITDLVISTGL